MAGRVPLPVITLTSLKFELQNNLFYLEHIILLSNTPNNYHWVVYTFSQNVLVIFISNENSSCCINRLLRRKKTQKSDIGYTIVIN